MFPVKEEMPILPERVRGRRRRQSCVGRKTSTQGSITNGLRTYRGGEVRVEAKRIPRMSWNSMSSYKERNLLGRWLADRLLP